MKTASKKLSNAVGGGTEDYSCSNTYTLLTEENVTTEIDPSYPEEGANALLSVRAPSTDAPTVRVTLNGTEYICQPLNGIWAYGAPFIEGSGYDWDEYPFVIGLQEQGSILGSRISTQTAGTYTVKIETIETTIRVSDCFAKAVKFVSSPLIVRSTDIDPETGNYNYDKTFLEVNDAFVQGRTIYIYTEGNDRAIVTNVLLQRQEGSIAWYVMGVSTKNGDVAYQEFGCDDPEAYLHSFIL